MSKNASYIGAAWEFEAVQEFHSRRTFVVGLDFDVLIMLKKVRDIVS